MTRQQPVFTSSFISPFLLPYIIADKEESDRISQTALESAVDETVMLTPMEDKDEPYRGIKRMKRDPIRQSFSPTRSTDTPISSGAHSTPPMRKSVLEASISELTFDPDLTFMDSPPDTSLLKNTPKDARGPDILNASLPAFDSPLKQVSPDRTLVPLDESEIGFSNHLRASIKVTEPGLKRTRDRVTAEPNSDVRGSPKRDELKSKARTHRKSRQVQVQQKPNSPSPKAGRSKVKGQGGTESQPAKLEANKSESSTVKGQVESGKVKAGKLPEIVRKSPRFASKVISVDDTLDLMVCPKCDKVYKRARDYERHVAGCK